MRSRLRLPWRAPVPLRPAGRKSPLLERLIVLRRFQKLLCDQKDSVAEIITREAGKPVAEALSTEVLVVLDGAEFLIDNAPEFLLPEPVPHANPIMKLKQGMLLRAAIWRDRHYQPVELSFQPAFRSDADCPGHRKCRGAEAFRIYPALVAGIATSSSRSGTGSRSVAGCYRRRCGRRRLLDANIDKLDLHRQRGHGQEGGSSCGGQTASRCCLNWAAKIP